MTRITNPSAGPPPSAAPAADFWSAWPALSSTPPLDLTIPRMRARLDAMELALGYWHGRIWCVYDPDTRVARYYAIPDGVDAEELHRARQRVEEVAQKSEDV